MCDFLFASQVDQTNDNYILYICISKTRILMFISKHNEQLLVNLMLIALRVHRFHCK